MIGNPVSFNQPEMQEVVSAMDLALNTALRRSLSGDTQPFAVTAKISFIPRDGAFRMEYEVGHQFEPIKQKEKGVRRYPLCFARDDYGLPALLRVSDQVSLDETLEVRKDDEPDPVYRCTAEICAMEFPVDQPEPEPYPCEETDCPLCDFGEVCEPHEDGTSLVPYEDKHIISAVEDFRCTRKFVRKRYGEIVEEANRDE